jgi:DNA-binding transcriptional regulator LsrR (DeoR family)
VVALALQKVPRGDIAARLGCSVATVSQHLTRARRAGIAVPAPDAACLAAPVVVLPGRCLPGLTRAAERRGMTAEALAARLVDAVVMERLIDAVLDDGCFGG